MVVAVAVAPSVASVCAVAVGVAVAHTLDHTACCGKVAVVASILVARAVALCASAVVETCHNTHFVRVAVHVSSSGCIQSPVPLPLGSP